MKRDSYFLFRSPRSYFVFVSSRILHNLHPKILSQDDYTGSPSPSRPDSFQGENHDEPRDFGPLRLQKRKKTTVICMDRLPATAFDVVLREC